MKALYNLHTHSFYSDGSLSPEEVVARAKGARLRGLALTDHDSVGGLGEAAGAAATLGLQFIRGVELTTFRHGSEVHILGYFSRISPELERDVRELRRQSEAWVLATADGIRSKAGLAYDRAELAGLARGEGILRFHLALHYVNRGYSLSPSAATLRFLAENSPYYIPRDDFQPDDAVALIHRRGGLAVVAHPGAIRSPAALEAALASGVDGIECHYWRHDPARRKEYVRLARARGLLVTGGGDFHSDEYGEIRDGVPDEEDFRRLQAAVG